MSEENKSLFTAEQIADLNKKHRGLSPTERIKLLYEDFGTDEIMLTSSFAATSAFLLKLFTVKSNIKSTKSFAIRIYLAVSLISFFLSVPLF